MIVFRPSSRSLRALLLISVLIAPAGLRAQRERQFPPPGEDSYGSRFFDQLRNIFGRFRDADLLHAFQTAEPIQCSELIVGKGEWRTVAFFNEDRSLGEWCRNSLEEVKSDLSVYIFKGTCRGDRGSIEVSTEFPVGASVEAYNARRIGLDQVDVTVNAPVSVVFDPRTQAYSFELPYLFLVGRRTGGNVYSLVAPHANDSYAGEVTSRWECKAVKSSDVTYRFLICRTATVPRSAAVRSRNRDLAFGASAYFILSDGKEAKSSVNLTFGDAGRAADDPRDTAPPVEPPARPSAKVPEAAAHVGVWATADVRAKVADVGKSEFRLRFSPQTWTGKIGSSELLFDRKISSPLSAWPQEGADYCSWHPGDLTLVERLLSGEPDADVSYSAQVFERNSRSAASILFTMRTRAGVPLGTLQCFFPRAQSVATVDIDRWTAVVGNQLALEIRR
jgi:hypothetical protein